jgi:hypothetical protein
MYPAEEEPPRGAEEEGASETGEGKEGILEFRDEPAPGGCRGANAGRPGPVCDGRDEDRAPARGLPMPSRDAGIAPARAADRGPGICSGPPATAAGVRET